MKSKILEDWGLSKNETKVYLALLRLGRANSAEIARESGTHRINVYDVLNSLISKGLVSYITEENTRKFKPENPEKLHNILKNKITELDTILPQLLSDYNLKKESCEVTILRGVEGKRSQFEEITRTARKTVNRIFTPHGLISYEKEPYKGILPEWFKILGKKGVFSRHLTLDNPLARNRSRMIPDQKNYKIKFSKEIHFSPVSWNVCCNLLFLTFHVDPYLIIRIKSKEIAQAFADSFDLMWKTVRK